MKIDSTKGCIWGDQHRSSERPLIRVAIVEDDRTTRNFLVSIIESAPSLRLVGSFPDGESAMKQFNSCAPDVVIMDIQLPGNSGVDCTRFIKISCPNIQILIFTVFSDSEHVMEAIKAGASGYLLKRSSADQIIKSIENVADGGAPMGAGIARLIVDALYCPQSAVPDDRRQELWQLTEREYEILQLLAKGYSAKELANQLVVSEPTIRFHLRNIYGKLHVHSRTEAVVKFLQ